MIWICRLIPRWCGNIFQFIFMILQFSFEEPKVYYSTAKYTYYRILKLRLHFTFLIIQVGKTSKTGSSFLSKCRSLSSKNWYFYIPCCHFLSHIINISYFLDFWWQWYAIEVRWVISFFPYHQNSIIVSLFWYLV